MYPLLTGILMRFLLLSFYNYMSYRRPLRFNSPGLSEWFCVYNLVIRFIEIGHISITDHVKFQMSISVIRIRAVAVSHALGALCFPPAQPTASNSTPYSRSATFNLPSDSTYTMSCSLGSEALRESDRKADRGYKSSPVASKASAILYFSEPTLA